MDDTLVLHYVNKHIYHCHPSYIRILVEKVHCFPSLGHTKNDSSNILLIAGDINEFYVCKKSVFFFTESEEKNHDQKLETKDTHIFIRHIIKAFSMLPWTNTPLNPYIFIYCVFL